MPRKTPIARISITIPADRLKEADRLAAELDRSRSWVMGEAVRRWEAELPAPEPALDIPVPDRDFWQRQGDARWSQLRADMALGVDDRVFASEDGNRLDRELRPPCPGVRLTFFHRFEDYLNWKRYEGIIR